MPCKRYKDYFLAPIEVEILCFKLTGFKVFRLEAKIGAKSGNMVYKNAKAFRFT